MSEEREHDILIKVNDDTRRRMGLVKAIIAMQTGQFQPATWSDVVQWLVDTVPIPELLAELCKPANAEAPQGA